MQASTISRSRIEQQPLWALVHRIEQIVDAGWAATSMSLTLRQFQILDAIKETSNSSQTDLVAATGIDRSTLADIMRRLLRDKLITRRRSHNDRRAYVVGLTPRGHAMVDAGRSAAHVAERPILATLSASERKLAHALLAKIVSEYRGPGGAS